MSAATFVWRFKGLCHLVSFISYSILKSLNSRCFYIINIVRRHLASVIPNNPSVSVIIIYLERSQFTWHWNDCAIIMSAYCTESRSHIRQNYICTFVSSGKKYGNLLVVDSN